MPLLLILIVIFIQQGLMAQRPSMPTSMPGLTPMAGAASRSSLASAGLKYNDGSFLNEKSGDIKGSPFLVDDWQYGSATLKTREQFDSLFVKYDMVEDQLLIRIDDQVYKFSGELDHFTLFDSAARKTYHYRNGFPPVAELSSKTFYEVLYDGKTKLLFKSKKIIVSAITSTPGVKEKAYDLQNSYYIYTAAGDMKKIKKRNTGITDLFPDQSEALRRYIKQQQMGSLNDAELIKLLSYYDSL